MSERYTVGVRHIRDGDWRWYVCGDNRTPAEGSAPDEAAARRFGEVNRAPRRCPRHRRRKGPAPGGRRECTRTQHTRPPFSPSDEPMADLTPQAETLRGELLELRTFRDRRVYTPRLEAAERRVAERVRALLARGRDATQGAA